MTCGVLAGAAWLAAAGCGYRVVGPAVGGGRALAVPTAVNDTRWRGAEAFFTAALRSDAQRLLDVRLAAGQPDLVLRTTILDVQRDAPVREVTGGAAAGSVTLEVVWVLEDAAGGALGHGSIRRTLEFLPSEGEAAEGALSENLDSMAEFVVIEVGARLAGRPAGS